MIEVECSTVPSAMNSLRTKKRKLANGRTGQRRGPKGHDLIRYEEFYNEISKRRKPAPLRELTSMTENLPRETIPLAVGYPNSDTFPIDEINISLKDGTNFTLRQDALKEALQYLPSVGYRPLINLLKDLQDRVHGKQPWAEKDLLITSGSQEGLSKAVDMLIRERDPVIIQHPVYPGASDLLRPHNPEFVLAEQDEFGIQPLILEEQLENRQRMGKPMPKIMYINPTAANPTGTTLSLERRLQIYRLACKYNFIILEDDPYYYLHFLEEDPRSFLSLDTEGRVLRFDSFSKILSSGLRVGFITGSRLLLRRIELHMQVSSMHSSALSQVILYNILHRWGYDGFRKHLAMVRHFYKQRRDCMMKAAEKYLKGLAEWKEPSGGMFLWLKIKDVHDAQNLVMKKCIENLLVVAPGYVFYEKVTGNDCTLRLSYSAATNDQIESGIQILANLVKEEKRR